MYYLEYDSWARYKPISGFLSFMLRPEYENNLRILIITIPESEIEIERKTPSWVWDLLVITTQCDVNFYTVKLLFRVLFYHVGLA